MNKISFSEALTRIVADDPRYDQHAYLFIREALDFTIQKLEKPVSGPKRHVSGTELLEGIRAYALQEFGPMAHRVLNHWGIFCCEDFGEMVFNMVDKGILGKTERDHKDDFKTGYNFEKAFITPFKPAASPADSLADSSA